MLSNINKQFSFLKMLNPKTITHLHHCLLGKWSDIPSQNHNCIGYIFILHTICENFNGLDAYFLVFREEDKELVVFIVGLFLLFNWQIDAVSIRMKVVLRTKQQPATHKSDIKFLLLLDKLSAHQLRNIRSTHHQNSQTLP